MGLDITFTIDAPKTCPHCGKVVENKTIDFQKSGGRVWYDFLASIDYYDPGSDESDWYGMDMILTQEQVHEAYRFIQKREPRQGEQIRNLLARATMEGLRVTVNADW